MRLRRVRAGMYRTLDGRFTIVKDPLSGSERQGYGYTSWLVYDTQATDHDRDAPVWLDNIIAQYTLRAVRELLPAYMAEHPTTPPPEPGTP